MLGAIENRCGHHVPPVVCSCHQIVDKEKNDLKMLAHIVGEVYNLARFSMPIDILGNIFVFKRLFQMFQWNKRRSLISYNNMETMCVSVYDGQSRCVHFSLI